MSRFGTRYADGHYDRCQTEDCIEVATHSYTDASNARTVHCFPHAQQCVRGETRFGWMAPRVPVSDPDEVLRKLQEVVAKIRDDETARTLDAYLELETVTDAFESLDEWLSKGGALPRAWQHNRCQGSTQFGDLTSPSDFRLGDYVGVRPGTDAWLQGERWGHVDLISDATVHVRMERSGDVIVFHPQHLRRV